MSDEQHNLELALAGDEQALNEVLAGHREKLKRFVRFRLSSQIRRRIDESDVVQEAFIEIAKRLDDFEPDRGLTFYQWLRHLVGLKAAELHRFHMRTQARDARREAHVEREDDQGNLVNLADQLVDSMTSPTRTVRKREMQQRIRDALQTMDEIDQEILYLRHFEQLSTQETANVIGMSKAGAGSRYLRALERLRTLVDRPGDGSSFAP